MVHPKIDHGYHELSANYPSKSKKVTDMFIGRFSDDKLYHLLGYRPHDEAYLFSAESESNQNLGIVKLPKGKKNLADLVAGDILIIGADKARFIKFN